MNTPRDASYDDYLGEALKDPAEAAAYIEAVMELDDPAALLVALRHVAKAHGMAEVARRAEMGDKTLFKALSENGNPTLSTLHKVLHAVGLRLSVAPAGEQHEGAHA
jgi:probable addiction module antidote protein